MTRRTLRVNDAPRRGSSANISPSVKSGRSRCLQRGQPTASGLLLRRSLLPGINLHTAMEPARPPVYTRTIMHNRLPHSQIPIMGNRPRRSTASHQVHTPIPPQPPILPGRGPNSTPATLRTCTPPASIHLCLNPTTIRARGHHTSRPAGQALTQIITLPTSIIRIPTTRPNITGRRISSMQLRRLIECSRYCVCPPGPCYCGQRP